ncbi:hypothetical protein CEXT_507371 [Caerostris extrusa]|uniref:LAGLIDADG homing endonuclease n=1 Tax=Caerostris extrusa TaxID=172846 RepID=A0AAV4M859_CAEEX|nr:hypothetical protein CEXT_507371 [Caerostris extrusa]
MTALQAPFANSIPGSPGQSAKWFGHRTPSWIIRFPATYPPRYLCADTEGLNFISSFKGREKIFIRKGVKRKQIEAMPNILQCWRGLLFTLKEWKIEYAECNLIKM